MEVHERIRFLRENLNMSQQELAEKIGYKDKSAISKVERGDRDINQSLLVKYADALNTTPAYLMGWLDEPESHEEMILNEKEKSIIEKLRTLPDDKVELVLQMIDAFGGNETNET